MSGKVLKIRNWFPVYPCSVFFKTLLDFVYPPICYICNNRLTDSSEVICSPCWEALPRVKENPLEINRPGLGDMYFHQSVAVWNFDAHFQSIIHLYKYQEYTKLARQIGKKMAEVISFAEEFNDADYLVPVPLHPARKRERGYNQSSLLCEQISKLLGIKVADKFLRRIRHTKTQTHLNAMERAKNVRQAFGLKNTGVFAERKIILVDDVLTTGATMNACARILIEAGASEVLVATAARV